MSAQPHGGGSGLVEELNRRYRGALTSFFRRRVRDSAEVEDLVQETFLKLARAAEREAIDDPESLLFTIAANLARDTGRKAQRRLGAQLADIDDRVVSEITREFVEVLNPERVLLARLEVGEILRALDELGERTRDVYVLHRLERMSHKEIAGLLGISTSTTEKHVIRAHVHLAQRFRSAR